MSSVSFTYGGSYDPTNIVIMSQNGLELVSGPSFNLTLGPFYLDRYIVNNDGFYSNGGLYFIDSQRFEGDPQDLDPKIINGSEYSIKLDASDRTGIVYATGSNFGDILRAGSDSDTLIGGGGNDLLEGGAGADTIDGGDGIDTVSYAHASEGVRADLLFGVNIEGDASGDIFTSIENLEGSIFADNLRGDDGNNTLRGNGGADNLYGQGGNDRIVASAGAGDISGGAGIDSLFVVGGGTFTVDPARFVGIEKVYVRDGTNLDMSDTYGGMLISSNSKLGAGVSIIGTHNADRISAGSGGDTLEGGEGGDKLFAGAGSDTFHFQAGFGRDNVYGFNAATDHITVDIAGVDATDIKLTSFHAGQDTIVTFVGVETGNKIILHDVTLMDAQSAIDNGLFTFGG